MVLLMGNWYYRVRLNCKFPHKMIVKILSDGTVKIEFHMSIVLLYLRNNALKYLGQSPSFGGKYSVLSKRKSILRSLKRQAS